MRAARPGAFLNDEEKARVEKAIAAAERQTSGEIRVVISRKAGGDPLAAAQQLFHRLEMHRTRERNGVLVLLAIGTRSFAILGDEGVHRHVGQEGWERVRDGMGTRFAQDDFAGGLVYAVEEVAKVLREHFPWREGDANELPDAVVEE